MIFGKKEQTEKKKSKFQLQREQILSQLDQADSEIESDSAEDSVNGTGDKPFQELYNQTHDTSKIQCWFGSEGAYCRYHG